MNAAIITGLNQEEATEKLWYEFLTGFFDGGVHAVQGSGVAFPVAQVGFAVADLEQPINGLALVVATETVGQRRYQEDGVAGGDLVFDAMRWTFYVKAKGSLTGQGNSRSLCRDGSRLLRAVLLDNGAKLLLAQKGLQNVAATMSAVVGDKDYAVRMVRVTGTLSYEVGK